MACTSRADPDYTDCTDCADCTDCTDCTDCADCTAISHTHANISSLSRYSAGEMMLRHLGWLEAADLVIKGMDKSIKAGTVTYDFHRMMIEPKPTLLKCSEFGDAIIKNMA